MKPVCILGLTAITAVLGMGCASAPLVRTDPPPMTPEMRTAMQTRILRGTVDTALAATIAILQDDRWRIVKADRATGLLQAETERRLEALSPAEERITDFKTRREAVHQRHAEADQWTRWEEITAHIEPWGARVRERITVARRGALPPMTYTRKIGGTWFTSGQSVLVNAPAREEAVEVPFQEVYQDLFGRIQNAIAARQSEP